PEPWRPSASLSYEERYEWRLPGEDVYMQEQGASGVKAVDKSGSQTATTTTPAATVANGSRS
ncbi:MAG: hypothetical protein ACKVQK_21830, partial [Burkholderiales bacterium]